jgi:tetratricopeptide (TPR) repeat protein
MSSAISLAMLFVPAALLPAQAEGPAAPPPRPVAGSAWRFVPAPCGPCLAGWFVPIEARGGAPQRHMPPALEQTGLKAGDAPELYRRGYALYWQGDWAGALPYFEAATRLADDARYWYYRALAERALGNHAGAARSLRRANDLERRGRPRGDVLGLALERVQGPLRRWLREGAAPERVDGR